MTLFWLCFFALLAGFIDAVSGGGGLIQLPALLVLKADTPLPALLGTNKISSVAGTITATVNYMRKVAIHWRLLVPAIVAAFGGSRLGAQTTSIINEAYARPVMLVLLIIIAVYTLFKPDLGAIERPMPQGWRAPVAMTLIGAGVGFYDGFFGPGTGSLLAFLFVAVMGLDFLQATASAKVINLTTNVAALSYFISNGLVLWQIGLPMALCNLLGGLIGSHMALSRGSRFIRIIFLTVLALLIVRYAYDIIA